MPRIKSDEERGYVGAWMRRERMRPDRDWSPAHVVELLAKADQRIREDYYRQIEAGSGGKVPGPELLTALEGIFGTRPEPFPAPERATETAPDLIAALVRHTAAMEAQTAVMGELVGWLASLAGEAVAGGVGAALQVRAAGVSPRRPRRRQPA